LTRRRLDIAIPASVVSDTPHLREKTAKIGLIGRTAAIFKVNEIIIYPDNPMISQMKDADLISTLLNYIETPQYLRKRLFGLKPELEYAGILPPLRTPHHPLNRRMHELKIGTFREGFVLSKTKENTFVDIGVDIPAILKNCNVAIGQRLTVRIIEVKDRPKVCLSAREEVPFYWGYTVKIEKLSFAKLAIKREFDLVIGTSRYGVAFKDVKFEIERKLETSGNVLIAFGAPSQGLQEIVRIENEKLEDIADFVVNMVPGQGTETVRTEEALIASLAILNVCFSV
jgi:predicted SPOUT superfamily RNA methylase MTH1